MALQWWFIYRAQEEHVYNVTVRLRTLPTLRSTPHIKICDVLFGRVWEGEEASSRSFFNPELTRDWTWPYGDGLLLCELRSCCLATRRRFFSPSFSVCSPRTLSWRSSIISSIPTSLTLQTGWPAPPAASCSIRPRSFTSLISLVPSLKDGGWRGQRSRNNFITPMLSSLEQQKLWSYIKSEWKPLASSEHIHKLFSYENETIQKWAVYSVRVCVSHFLILSSCVLICCLRCRVSSWRRRNRSSSSSLDTREMSCRARAFWYTDKSATMKRKNKTSSPSKNCKSKI